MNTPILTCMNIHCPERNGGECNADEAMNTQPTKKEMTGEPDIDFQKCVECKKKFATGRGLNTHITRSHTGFSGFGTDEHKNYSI